MSKKKQETKEEERKLPDASKALREMYDQFWKQTAEQWDEVARNPQFLAMMAANLNQSLDLRARVQEMVVGVMRTLNIPTRDDLAALTGRLEQLGEQLNGLERKIDSLSTGQPKETKQAAGAKKRIRRRA